LLFWILRCFGNLVDVASVSAAWQDLLQNLIYTSFPRRVMEVLFRSAARRHLARLDSSAPARCQERILRGLVYQASSTRFGRDHDFRRIRCSADYRRLVPVRARADLWRAYWGPNFPHVLDATWPGPITWAPGRPLDDLPRPLCPPEVYRAALRTVLALIGGSCPRAALFGGAIVALPDDALDARTATEALRERFPALARPYAMPVLEPPALEPGSSHWGTGPTCLFGPVDRILALADLVLRWTGRSSLGEAWPALAAIVWTGQTASALRLRDLAGPRPMLMEMVLQPEGPIAIEDRRLGGLRLLTDHGVHFELLPVGTAAAAPRLGLGEVELGTTYELLLTSTAGIWSSRLGLAVRFERRDPPVVQFVDVPMPAAVAETAARCDVAAVTPAQPPHRQTAGTPVGPPRTFVHTPWSTAAGRG
jgi:hypothetical protein